MKKTEFLRLRKKLILTVKEYNPEIITRYFPLSRPYKMGVSGSYDPKTKKIKIKVYGNQSYTLQLLVLAHEIRHLQHHQQNLFSDYYREVYNEKNFIDKVIAGEESLPSESVALDAENDCNTFARTWAESVGLKVDYNKRTYSRWMDYPEMDTYAFALKLKYFETLRRKNIDFKVVLTHLNDN